KGISQAVNVYRVRAEGGAPSRFEAAAQRGLTPLVGRESEIGLLLNRWEQAKDSEGQVVLLSGEAGIGKSRIVRGFRDRLEAESHNRVLYYGSPYHQNSAFYPAIDQLERGLRFAKSDTAAQKLDKLDAVLSDLSLPVADYASVLASLLSLSTEDRYPALELDPEQLKRKTIGAMITVIQTTSTRQPVLMVIEDAHWFDPSTLELITGLIEQLQASRVFLLITCRPEFESPWGLRGHITSFTLNRLGRKECTAMISKLTKGKALPQEVVNQIIAKTDGVPLFVEELTKTVLESDVLEEEANRYVLSDSLPPLAIPASLHDSLMARLDRLGPAKEVAQLAATLGRTFTHELLTAVSSLTEEELEGALTHLAQAELIYRRGLPPDATYAFKHALVQDTAYQSLLKSTRQQFHQRIARTLEEQFPETAETEPELLAHHYTEAHLLEKAVGYWHRAGRRASERLARVEAVAHLTKGLELITSLPDTPDRARHELNLQITLAPALQFIKGWAAQEVEQAYLRAQELCRQVGERSQLFTVTWGLWHHYQHCGQLKIARDLANEVLSLAEKQVDSGFRLQAHHAAWTTHIALAELPSCREHAEKGIALYNLDEHRTHAFLYGGHDPGVCCRANGAIALWLLGYADQALEKTQDAVTLAEELGHPYGLGQALYFSAYLHQCRRDALLVQEHAEATIAFCEKQGMAPHLLAMGHVFRGWALTTEGQAKEGIAEMHEGLAALRAGRVERHRPYLLALLADAYRQAHQVDQGLSTLADALSLLEETGERTWEAEMYRLKGELVLAQSAEDQTEAKRCLNQTIEIARRQSAKSLELRAATSLSRLWRGQGKGKEARALLAPIYHWFTEGFDTSDLKDAKALLEDLG
ncbi:MAG: AAA family ATPase, partial [Acidiferrobacterales bacterium]